jgi:hypothetical protein
MLTLDDPDDAERVADWVELELSLGQSSFSKSTLISIIRDAGGSEHESFASDVWQNLRERIALYSTKFFEIKGDLVTSHNDVVDGRLEYEVCLFFSLYGASSLTGSNPKLFERMSAEAIEKHFNGTSFIFGWPLLEGVETEIAARVKQVSKLLRERFAESPQHRYKDRGVDIISWKPFAEPSHDSRRSSQLVVLSQCAAGHNWRSKAHELPMAAWKQYIHWATDPLSAFVVPCVIREDIWHDVARDVDGLVFDRVRLINNLSLGVTNPELKTALKTWCKEQIDEHRA